MRLDASSSIIFHDEGSGHGSIDVQDLVVFNSPILRLEATDPGYFTGTTLFTYDSISSGATFRAVDSQGGTYLIEVESSSQTIEVGAYSAPPEPIEPEEDPGTTQPPVLPEEPPVVEPPAEEPSDLDKLIDRNANYRSAAFVIDSMIESGDYPVLADRLSAYAEAMETLFLESPRLGEIAIKQLIMEPVHSIKSLSNDVALKSQGVVFGRLDAIRTLSSLTPPSAGSGDHYNRLWIGGFGSWADQKDDGDFYGYEYHSGGVAIGYDRHVESVNGLTLGISGSFSSGKLKSKDEFSTVDLSTAGIGVYASYAIQGGFFIDSNLSYALSQNEFDETFVLGGKRTGDFDSDTVQFGLRVGGSFTMGEFGVVPSIGIRCVYYSQKEWIAKTIDSFLPNQVILKKSDKVIEVPLEIRFQREFESGSVKITPQLRLGITFVAKKPDNRLDVGFVDSDVSFTTYGMKAKSNYFRGGFGLKVETASRLDFFVNYDLSAASKFLDHRISAGLGFDF
jgi:hypothetical protein